MRSALRPRPHARLPSQRFPLAFALVCVLVGVGGALPARAAEAPGRAPDPVIHRLAERACAGLAGGEAATTAEATPRERAVRGALAGACALDAAARAPAPDAGPASGAASAAASLRFAATSEPDGTLLARQRILGGFGIAVDLVAYASEGLRVGALLCHPDDGARHSTVVHLHGGFGGLFVSPDGDLVGTCIDWALKHGRTAIVPSYRGQDGGDGELEICLGEARDVVNAVSVVRSLEVTDPDRVGLVGGSVGGCVALKAAPLIPDLRAVVAFVPPMDWKSMVAFHRNDWSPVTETTCDGRQRELDLGGPDMADAIDHVVCGYEDCPDAEYARRSPLPGVHGQRAPTLTVSAGMDNVVPPEQGLLWPLMRQQAGHPVSLHVMDRCDPPAVPPLGFDVHLHVLRGTHGLGSNAISSGLLFLMNALDAPAAPEPEVASEGAGAL